jgi:hypothetical protein
MRRADWQLRLAQFMEQRASKPFAWGENDCCLFAADAVQAMTGTDYAKTLRGYSTQREALRLVQKMGGLWAIATGALGEPVSPLLAGVGDVVLLDNEGRELLAVCNGTTAVAPGADGAVSIGMETAKAAWRI